MVWIKRINNADSGDATHVGGNHWDLMDQYHDNVDISASITNPTKIATPTTYRDQILNIRNAADTFSYTLKAGTLTADCDVSLPNASGDITLIAAGAANDWGAVVQTFRHQAFKIMNPGNTFGYIFNSSAIVANRAVTLPLLTGDDTLVTNAVTATLTNKTIAIDSNVLKHSTTNTQGDIYKYDSASGKVIRVARGTADQFLKVNAAGTDVGFETVAAGGGGAADKCKVYEGGVLVGTVARKINFNAADFNCSADTVNDEIDIALSSVTGSSISPLVFKQTTQVTVVSTTTETNLFSYTVPAGNLGANDILRITMHATYLNNSGSTAIYDVRLKIGGTTVWWDASGSVNADANRRPIFCELLISNRNSVSSQYIGGRWEHGNAILGDVGISDISDDEIRGHSAISATSTANFASSQAITLSIEHSSSNANISFQCNLVTIEQLS